MKAILVIDTPNNCSECPCCNEGECGNKYKGYVGDYIGWNNGRPSWCPLKPMPEPIYVEANKIEDIMHTKFSIEDISAKIRLDTDKIFSLGWNACLKEIMGKTE